MAHACLSQFQIWKEARGRSRPYVLKPMSVDGTTRGLDVRKLSVPTWISSTGQSWATVIPHGLGDTTRVLNKSVSDGKTRIL